MIKEIVTDEEFLSKPAEPATAEDADVAQDLVDTMKSLDECACLAANQIGSTKAIIAYEVDGRFYTMYNPRIDKGIVAYTTVESCFSLKRETQVKRFRRINVTFEQLEQGKLVTRQRKLSEWTAEIVQHAIDHCNGVLV